MAEKILEIKGLKKYFPLKNGQVVKAVDGVDLELHRGETLGLVGESGSGKSTIAYVLVGMYEATDGDMIFKGCIVHCSKKERSRSCFRTRALRSM